MATTDTSTEAGILAGSLFDQLTAGTNFSLPAVDLTLPEFQIPTLEESAVPSLTEADLTTRLPGGTGMFDGLMEALKGHLDEQFTKQRITGNQYAEAYIAMTGTAMQAAVQYLLSKDQARWQAVLAQRQAAMAEIGIVNARVALEETKAKLAIARVQTEITEAEYALTKLKLSTEDASWSLQKAQLAQVQYQTTQILPVQRLDIIGGTSLKDAQRAQVTYETSAMLPAQKNKIDSEKAVVDYQLGYLYPAQVAGLSADTVGKEYTNEFILPANLTSIREQNEGHRAKTLNTRTDGTVVAGAMGIQKALYEEQIKSYKRDAEQKTIKMMLDTWITQKSMDEGTSQPTSTANAAIDTALNKLRANLSL